jgi:dephospho-CoA kinase
MLEQGQSNRCLYSTILGITGGLGCGKSTAARLFEGLGYRRLDSDALVRERVLPSPEVKSAVAERFGTSILGADGAIDRSKLAEIVFTDDMQRHWLESLTHPLVFEIGRAEMRANPEASWVVEVPLLFEKSLENWFDFTVCVACSHQQQLARLEQRGLPLALAEQRITKQLPLARKIELSDFVLWNEGSAPFLRTQVERLARQLQPVAPPTS